MPVRFEGMVGRTLAQQRLKSQIAANERNVAEKVINPGHSGKFLFVAHPNCCENCKRLGMTPHFFNTPDVAFITHPNCLCATIEAPANLSPAELMEWAENPTGELRFGWNYGNSLAPMKITERNRFNNYLKWQNRVRPIESLGRKSTRQRRATATEEQIRRIRRAVKRGTLGPAEDLTDSINAQIEAQRIARHNKAVQENAKGLRRGNTWNPNRSRPKRVSKASESSVEKMQKLFRGNTTVIPRNKKTIVGGSRIAMKKYDDEKKRKKRLEQLAKKLGI